MASTINGTSTGNGGLISTGDDSGILNIQTNETTAISIDASQNATFAGKVTSAGALTLASNGTTTAVTIDTSQNVGIGTTSPNLGGLTRALTINTPTGGNYSGLELAGAGTLSARFVTNNVGTYFGSQLAIPLVFETSATERMRIDSSGSVLIATTNTNPSPNNVYGIALNRDPNGNYYAGCGQFSANGTAAIITNRGSDDGQTIQFRRTGSNVGNIAVTTTATSYNTSSDYRLKENITPMTGALAKVAQLKPVTYKWKADSSESEGFVAHELAEVVPHAVTGAKDAVDADGNPQYQGIDTSFLVATLTAAIQELKAINDTQAETINALTARVVALESK
jgi:hypothetical protein